jgi:hypothetical protein
MVVSIGRAIGIGRVKKIMMHTRVVERENRQNAVNALRVYMMTILLFTSRIVAVAMNTTSDIDIDINIVLSSCQFSSSCVLSWSCVRRAARGGIFNNKKDQSLAVLRWSAGSLAICHSIGDHLVPLVLGLAVEQRNNDHGHVVAAHAARVAVRREAVVHQVLTYGV